MIITKRAWGRYIRILRSLSDKAAEAMAKEANRLKNEGVSAEVAAARLIDYAYAIATKYGEGSAAMACEMYDAIAALNGANVPPAMPAEPATRWETTKAVRGTLLMNEDVMPAAVGRLVKLAGVDTIQQNAIRDGAEWAWIPSGDSCAFCRMLASNGWQKASVKAIKNGHAQHIHNNCDCTYAVRFDGKSTVSGYDPDALYEEYRQARDEAGSGKTRDIVNAMDRKDYKRNRDEINARKRLEYAKRKELEKADQ